MALVERLAILITGDASGAINEMKKVATEAEKNATKADASASKFSGTATKISAGMMAAGAGVLSFAASAVSTTTDLGREVIKLQRYTGMNAESASKLAYAARMSGVDVDALAIGLGKLSKQLDADSPSFERLNIHTRDGNNKMRSMAEVLPDLADRFSKMADGPEKTAIALQLFGKSGMNLMPFLNKGAEGIKNLSAEAEKMGLVLSGDNVNDIKAHIRSQRELGSALDGVRNKIGLSMMPVMDAFTNVVKGIPGPIVEIIGPLAVFGGGALVAAGLIGMLITNITAIGPAISAVGVFLEANPIALAFTAVAAAAALAFVAIKAFGDQSKVDQASVDAFKDAVAASGVEAEKLVGKQIAASLAQAKLDEVFKKSHIPQGDFVDAIRESGKGLGEYATALKTYDFEKATELFNQLGPAGKKAIKDISDAFMRGDLPLKESEKLTDKLGELGTEFSTAASQADVLATTESAVASSAALAAEEHARLATAIQGVQDAMRATVDPVFAAMHAQSALKSAQNDYNDALKTHSANSPEAKEAYIKQVEAALSLTDALGKLAQSEITGSTTQEKFQQTMELLKKLGMDPSSTAAQQLAKDMGIIGYTALVTADTLNKSPLHVLTEDEQLQATIRRFKELEDLMIKTHQGGEGSSDWLRTHERDENGNWVPKKTAASGGYLTPGGPTLVGEHGPELFVPSSSGSVVNALSTSHAMAGGGGGNTMTVNITMPPGTDGAGVVEAIRKYERMNGTGWRN